MTELFLEVTPVDFNGQARAKGEVRKLETGMSPFRSALTSCSIAKTRFNDAPSMAAPHAAVAEANKVIIAQARDKVHGVDHTYLEEVREGMSSGKYFSLAMEPTPPAHPPTTSPFPPGIA